MSNCNNDCFLKSCEEHIAGLKEYEKRLSKEIYGTTKNLEHIEDKRRDLEQLIINWNAANIRNENRSSN